MKNRIFKKGLTIIIACFLLLSLIFYETINIPQNNKIGIVKGRETRYHSLDLISHDPIVIDSDDDFVTYGFPGSGTLSSPYMIEDLSIIDSGNNNGIYINGTTKHFSIRNCYIDAVMKGIYVSKAATGTAIILDNECVGNINEGIYIYYSNSSKSME